MFLNLNCDTVSCSDKLMCLFPCFLFSRHHLGRPRLAQICTTLHLQCHTAPLPLPTTSLRVSLRICSNPAVYRSLSRYHTKPGKAHTHAGLGSDKIKNTRQLIWIKGARSIRIEREILSLTERQRWTSAGLERKESCLRKQRTIRELETPLPNI